MKSKIILSALVAGATLFAQYGRAASYQAGYGAATNAPQSGTTGGVRIIVADKWQAAINNIQDPDLRSRTAAAEADLRNRIATGSADADYIADFYNRSEAKVANGNPTAVKEFLNSYDRSASHGWTSVQQPAYMMQSGSSSTSR